MPNQETRSSTLLGKRDLGEPRQDERWLTTVEACSYVRLHPATLRRAVRRGDLVAFRVNRGRTYRFRQADLDRYIELGEVLPQSKEASR